MHIIENITGYPKTSRGKNEDILESLQRLEESERDSLVSIEHRKVVILEKGKPFIRNICMAFDAHLWRKEPATRLFSNAI